MLSSLVFFLAAYNPLHLGLKNYVFRVVSNFSSTLPFYPLDLTYAEGQKGRDAESQREFNLKCRRPLLAFVPDRVIVIAEWVEPIHCCDLGFVNRRKAATWILSRIKAGRASSYTAKSRRTRPARPEIADHFVHHLPLQTPALLHRLYQCFLALESVSSSSLTVFVVCAVLSHAPVSLDGAFQY